MEREKSSFLKKIGNKLFLWAIALIALPFIIIFSIFIGLINAMNFCNKLLRKIKIEEIIVPLILGITVFSITTLLNTSLAISLFWGIAAAYFLFVCSTERTMIEDTAFFVGAALLIGGIVGVIFFKKMFPFWPVIFYGAGLCLLSLLKNFINDGNTPDNYDHPYN